MYRILIAVKRGKSEYENIYKWYSERNELEEIVPCDFPSFEEASEKVEELLKDPDPKADYSYNDLVIVDYVGYDVEIVSV